MNAKGLSGFLIPSATIQILRNAMAKEDLVEVTKYHQIDIHELIKSFEGM